MSEPGNVGSVFPRLVHPIGPAFGSQYVELPLSNPSVSQMLSRGLPIALRFELRHDDLRRVERNGPVYFIDLADFADELEGVSGELSALAYEFAVLAVEDGAECFCCRLLYGSNTRRGFLRNGRHLVPFRWFGSLRIVWP
jgi:hypothetical protein